MSARLELAAAFALAGLIAPFAGCSGGVEPGDADVEQASEALTMPAPRGLFYTARRDPRMCPSPACGGYFLKRVNSPEGEIYASRLDFTAAFDDATIGHVLRAGDGEVVLRGRLGPEDEASRTRPLVVTEAFHGMPGIVPRKGDPYYQVTDREPPIACFVAPCNNELARTLNTAKVEDFTELSVGRAEKPHVDAGWLVERIRHHGAVVTGRFAPGDKLPGGYEKRLMASQVFVRLPDVPGPCEPVPRIVCPGSFVPGFDRDDDRCFGFAGCVDRDACMATVPEPCAPGYLMTRWVAKGDACFDYACDPRFVSR